MTDEDIKSKIYALEFLVNQLEQKMESVIADGDNVVLICCWGGDPRKHPHYVVKRIKEVQ